MVLPHTPSFSMRNSLPVCRMSPKLFYFHHFYCYKRSIKSIKLYKNIRIWIVCKFILSVLCLCIWRLCIACHFSRDSLGTMRQVVLTLILYNNPLCYPVNNRPVYMCFARSPSSSYVQHRTHIMDDQKYGAGLWTVGIFSFACLPDLLAFITNGRVNFRLNEMTIIV